MHVAEQSPEAPAANDKLCLSTKALFQTRSQSLHEGPTTSEAPSIPHITCAYEIV